MTTMGVESMAMAHEMLAELGQSCTIERDTADHSIDVVHPVIVTQVATCSDLVEVSDRWVNGDTVRAGDAKLFLAAEGLDWPPTTGDVAIVASGARWRVERVSAFTAAGSVYMHALHMRRTA